jgi:hypothetical protein
METKPVSIILTLIYLFSIVIVSIEFQQQTSLYAREVSLETMRLLRLNHTLSQAHRQVSLLASMPIAEGTFPRISRAVVSSAHEPMLGPPPLVIHQASFPMQPPPPPPPHLSMTMLGTASLTRPIMSELWQHGSTGTIVRGGGGGGGDDVPGHSSTISQPVAQYLQMHEQQQQQQQQQRAWTTRSRVVTPGHLPQILSSRSDVIQLTKFQVFLRLHIEAFAASPIDVAVRTRGRNKAVVLNQVGIRCRHCAHVPINERVRGSVYFPSTTMGFYQAAQNMSSTHLQCGLCPEMPESIKNEFALLIGTKTAASSSAGGRLYWGRCAQQMGLVDTEQGIFAVGTIPEGTAPL